MIAPQMTRPVVLLTAIARAVLMALVPALLAAQSPRIGILAGRVVARPDSGGERPLAGVTVSIVGSSANTTTDGAGRFVVNGAPIGAVRVRMRLVGYRTVERAVRVRANDTTRVNVTLLSDVQLLSAVRVSASPFD